VQPHGRGANASKAYENRLGRVEDALGDENHKVMKITLNDLGCRQG
jgi:hypothetical protein